MAEDRAIRSPARGLKRVALLVGMTLATLNVWTGSPLMALWVGSRVFTAGSSPMTSFGVVFATMLAISLALVKVLGLMGSSYDRLVGREPSVRRHTPWLRSMRGERPHEEGPHYRLSALDRVLVISVVIAVVAFEIWFFFFSGSPIDQRSGRD